MSGFVAFGELLLRLSPPGHELLLQTPRLDVWVGGAEANVATALARLGHRVGFVSAVPETALGDAAIGALRGHGVDTRRIARGAGRMGLYFATRGAGVRAGEVLYDRADSAFAAMPPEAWDWPALLRGADRLHLSGITPALGDGPGRAARAAAEAAVALGVAVSFDGNYRARLWQAWDGDPRALLTPIVAAADIFFGDRRDLALLLGHDFAGDAGAAAAAAFAAFPRLRLIAGTQREVETGDCHRLSARLDAVDGSVTVPPVTLAGIVERIGGGDAFAAGVLHALAEGSDLAEAGATGLALAALKHSLPGDASLFSRADLAAVRAGARDIRR